MATPQRPALDAAAVQAHVEFLADDLLEGRAPGSRGHELAARYVAAQLQALGIEPAGIDDGWLQPVTVVESTRLVPAARATLSIDGQRKEWRPGHDFLPLPSYHAAEARVEAPLAFVGYGVVAPEWGHDDLAGLDLRGKVAVVLSGVPDRVPPALRDFHAKQKDGLLAARGAVGLVELRSPEAARRTAWARSQALAMTPGVRLLDASGLPLDAPPGLEAGIVLDTAAAEWLLAGVAGTTAETWQAAAVRPRSVALRGRIEIATRSSLRRVTSSNVVGVLRGRDPRLRDEYVVLLAHLDHIGRGVSQATDAIYNGALDNAAGVAVLLEAARMIAAAPRRPRRSILFLVVTAEERGLHGSRHFALQPTVPRGSIVAALNLDMPVALYPSAGYVVHGGGHSTLGAIARRALAAEGLRVLPDQAPERGLFTYTDQFSFVREGVPSLYLHDGPVSSDPSVDARAAFDGFLRDHYHQPSDQTDLPIHWPSLAALARVHARLCVAIANRRDRPRWLPGDQFGLRYGRFPLPDAARETYRTSPSREGRPAGR